MNDLAVFNNPDFGSVRTLMVGDIPYFVGKDVANILGYVNPQKLSALTLMRKTRC